MEGDRLAEILGAVSLATDMARGQALESAMGTCVLATRIARHLDLAPEELAVTYYTAISRTLGCTSTAMEVAPLVLGDDRSFSYAMHLCDLADRDSVRAELERHLATDSRPEDREAAIERVLEHHAALPEMAAPTGHQAAALSRRLPLPAEVSSNLALVDARWDGKNPLRPAGEAIPRAMRIVEFAVVAELFRRAGGAEAMVALAESRAGGQFDPGVCATFRAHAAQILEGFDAPSLFALYLESEPAPVRFVDGAGRRLVAGVAADYADNKSGFFVGHSRRVARVASAAARKLGLSEADQDAALFAGLLHDLGRCGISNGIWDHAGPLTDRGRLLAESHSALTETVLTACSALRGWSGVASAAHERCDGSGYHHRRTRLDAVSELVAAADVYVALTQPRPWRDAFSEGEAAELLAKEMSAGRLSPRAGRAVLEVSGQQRAADEAGYPDGLTTREVDVLVLIARGLATKQVAAELGIAFKTADNHIQNLYRKIGASSRAAAAMYAVERGLVAPRIE